MCDDGDPRPNTNWKGNVWHKIGCGLEWLVIKISNEKTKETKNDM